MSKKITVCEAIQRVYESQELFIETLRIHIMHKARPWIDEDNYLCVKYKQNTYHSPLPKNIDKNIKRWKGTKNEKYLLGLVDYIFFSLMAEGKAKLTAKEIKQTVEKILKEQDKYVS